MKMIANVNFRLERNVLNLVYVQTVLWLSYFFSPLMTLVAVFLLFFYFYLYLFKLKVNSKPSEETAFKAAGVNTLFMVVLIFSFLFVVFILGYILITLHPSKSCGPFRNNQNTIIETIGTEIKSWMAPFDMLVIIISNHAFLIAVAIFFLITTLYFRSVLIAHRQMTQLLQRQLQIEVNDARQKLVQKTKSPAKVA